ncbi:MAG: hypothetical protein KJ955_06660 [Nanoarchaeota archaeon]|nr:hypothetical protein [Nanoarchaeota archaeon]
MKRPVFYFSLVLLIGIFMGVGLAASYPYFQSFESRRATILNDMEQLIEEQVKEGNYRCCIEPACTMCFMGSWIWDDGICRCDDMIASGQDDKVCPQCKKGLEEGRCKSSDEDFCEVKAAKENKEDI